MTSDELSQPVVRHLIVDGFVQDYLTLVFENHGWTKYQEKIETRNIDLFFRLPGSCVLDHLKVLTINCNLASNFYLLSPLCFLFVAVQLTIYSQRKFPPLELILSLESSAKKHYMNQFILS